MACTLYTQYLNKLPILTKIVHMIVHKKFYFMVQVQVNTGVINYEKSPKPWCKMQSTPWCKWRFSELHHSAPNEGLRYIKK